MSVGAVFVIGPDLMFATADAAQYELESPGNWNPQKKHEAFSNARPASQNELFYLLIIKKSLPENLFAYGT